MYGIFGETGEIKSESINDRLQRVELPERVMYLNVKKMDATSEWLSAEDFAEWLDAGLNKIKKIIEELGIEGRLGDNGEVVYPPLTFEIVSEEYSWQQKYSHIAPMVSSRFAGKLFDRDYRYVTKEAEKFNYYPSESVEIIKNCIKKIPKNGEDWYTAGRICQETGKSLHWVASRLKLFEDKKEIRLDDMGVGRIHYPSFVFENILKQANAVAAKSGSGDWITIKKAAEMMGIGERSAYRKLTKLELDVERRKTDSGKVVLHYNPLDIEKIVKESEEYIDINTLVKKIGKSAYVICSRLEKSGIKPVDSCHDSRLKLYKKSVVEGIEFS